MRQTPDHVAHLHESLTYPGDPETQPQMQPRPNVLYEAGMAMGRNPDRTVMVELGQVKVFSDIHRRHAVRLDNSIAKRQDLANRRNAGCAGNLERTDWHDAGDLTPPSPPGGGLLQRCGAGLRQDVRAVMRCRPIDASRPARRSARRAVGGQSASLRVSVTISRARAWSNTSPPLRLAHQTAWATVSCRARVARGARMVPKGFRRGSPETHHAMTEARYLVLVRDTGLLGWCTPWDSNPEPTD